MLGVVAVLLLALHAANAFNGIVARGTAIPSKLSTICRIAHRSKPQQSRGTTHLNSFFLADGLDAETLDALGEVQELNYALDGVVDGAVNPAVGILVKLASSPAILVIPILAGLLVAVAFGYFVSSYGQGRDD